jgi:PIN domain nuclease of toxin-antitoxin system
VIILDTHALVWAVAESKKLSRSAQQAIRKSRLHDGVAVAAVTLWELACSFPEDEFKGMEPSSARSRK